MDVRRHQDIPPTDWGFTKRRPSTALLSMALGAVALTTMAAQEHPRSASHAGPVTFSRDVLPILQKNCQSCHRPSEIAPMSFLAYESTRPWARVIKAVVIARKMPPWFADPQHGHFSNDRTLKPSDIDALVKWVDGGAVMGDPHDAPPAIAWPDGWQITPDHVVTVPEVPISANGTVEWGYMVVPSGFSKDTWVSSIEIRPGARESVHHVEAFVKPHSPDIPYNMLFWDQHQRDARGASVGQPFHSQERVSDTGQVVRVSDLENDVALAGIYVPGVPPQDFRADRAAKLIPANSDLLLQVHDVTLGKPVTEITRIGFTIAKEAPVHRYLTLVFAPDSFMDPKVLRIPAGNPNWASPPVDVTFNVDAELVWMMPHMHARGKDMTYRLTFPDG